MIIRTAGWPDIPRLCEIAHTFVEESEHDWVYSQEISAHTWESYIKRDNVVVLVAEEGETIAGGAVLAHDRDFTLNRVGYVIKFYILPRYRRTRAPIMVAMAIAAWFDEQQCWASFATASAGIGADKAFIKLIARQGFQPYGPTLMRKANG